MTFAYYNRRARKIRRAAALCRKIAKATAGKSDQFARGAGYAAAAILASLEGRSTPGTGEH